MDEKSTIGKKCNSKANEMISHNMSPSIQTLDIIRMFARVYSAKEIELQTDSLNF